MAKENKKKKAKHNVNPNQGKNVSVDVKAVSNNTEIENFVHPIFCFRHIHKEHNLDVCTPDEKISLIERMVKLSGMTWLEIQSANKHGLGTEKIEYTSIKPSRPPFITKDVTFLLAARFHGKAPFLFHRNNQQQKCLITV